MEDDRKIKLDDGTEVYYLKPEEVADFEEAKKKVGELGDKMKAIEEDPSYKNNAILRKKWEDAQKERDEFKTKLDALTPKNEPKPVSQEDIDKSAEAAANRVYLNKYRDRVLSQYRDKKEVVKTYFEKLSAGETLDEAKIDELAGAAAKAAGIDRKPSPVNQAIAGMTGGTPEFEPQKNDFSETDEGKARGDAMGLHFTKEPKK